jgi:hypothetical protein
MLAQVPLPAARCLFSLLSALHEASQPAQNVKDRSRKEPKQPLIAARRGRRVPKKKEVTLLQAKQTDKMERKEWEGA